MHHGYAGRFWAAMPDEHWPDDLEWRARILEKWDEPWGDRRQEIVFIGQDMDVDAASAALDSCLLTEAEEQKWRLVEIFTWLLFMAVVSLLLLMVLVALSILVLPPGWRVVGLCFWVIVGFGTIGLGVYRVQKYAQQSSPMFAETMNQLKKDQACFSDPT